MAATANRNLKCIKNLKEEMQMQNDLGHTALIIATIKNDLDSIKLLLTEISVKDNKKWSALAHASYYG